MQVHGEVHPRVIVEVKPVVGATLAVLDIDHLAQLVIEAYYTYNEESLIGILTDSVTWHVFYFKREEKKEKSPLMTIKWLTETVQFLARVLEDIV